MKIAVAFLTMAMLASPAVAQDLAPVALNSLSAVPPALASAKLFDERGHDLGSVTKTVADQNGKPAAIAFADAAGKPEVIAAASVSYDQQKNILVADTSQERQAAN